MAKNDRSEGLLKFINNVTKDLKDHLENNENEFWNNLDNDQRKALCHIYVPYIYIQVKAQRVEHTENSNWNTQIKNIY